MGDIRTPQNPGIGGLDELTANEELTIQQIAGLGDPNADRILFWDDSANSFQYLTAGSGLTITGTTMTAAGGGGSGMVIGDPVTSGTAGSILFVGTGPVLAQDNASLYFDDTNNRLGLLTTAPTHTTTFGSTSTGIALYNTSDQTTNYERVTMAWATNVFTIATGIGGTGTTRNIVITGGNTSLTLATSSNISRGTTSVAGPIFTTTSTFNSSSIVQTALGATPTINQSGTAGYTALLINPTESATGSGTKRLIDAQVGGTSRFWVDNAGNGHLGAVSPSDSNVTLGGQGLDIAGTNNTLAGVNIFMQNKSNGTAAFTAYVLENDLADGTNSHYAVLNLNSSTYSDTTYGTINAVSNQLQIYGTDGPTTIGTSKSGSFVNFFVGGLATANEVARLASTGLTVGLAGTLSGNIVLPGATSGTVTIRANAVAGTATIFELPATNGTNGWFLKTNGSGVTSWAAASGASPLTTKGDIHVYSTTDDRLPVGTNGQLLSSDSTAATGLKWITASGTGTVTSVATDATLTGGTITTTGTLGINLANSNAWTAAQTIAVTSATAFVVGLGLTNPAFAVNTNTASSATGISITSAAAGGAVALTATSSGSNEQLTIGSKGTGNLTLQSNAGNKIVIASTTTSYSNQIAQMFTSYSASNTASTVRFSVTDAADAALTLSVEAPHTYWNLGSAVRTHATGALTLQRDFRITGSNHAFAGASTITNCAVFSIDGPSIGGTNATITNSHGLYIPTLSLSNVTNGYSATFVAPSGAGTINAAAQFTGAVYMNDGADATKRVTWALSGATTATTTTLTISQTANRTITYPDATDTLVGKATTDTLTNKTLTSPSIATPTITSSWNFGAHTAYFTETDNGNSSTADTIDWTISNKQKSTLTGNCTFTFTAPPGPCSLVLKLVQDGTGSRTVTWPAAVHWSGGTAPTLTTTINKVDIVTFYYDGTTYFGNSSLNYTA